MRVMLGMLGVTGRREMPGITGMPECRESVGSL